MIKFNQNAWSKSYIDMNTDLRKKVKNDFGKTMENVRTHRDIKLVTTERRKNYLVSEPNYHTTKFFTQHLLAIEMKKAQIHMTRAVYLGLLTLELSTILMYEF